ncbi:glycosyltransferase [Paenibacillus sp. F6_3S_P_1C]|uniref:Glycosyltransferase n=1 Tax=Paenibacillus vandeheii TaxID=3035917 RepID=A0ABT8JEX9_9BACL|nr:glycosyltransferase [Paenibacillus vandeheii]MDN4603665.1 glycosyltransferase [Paenibacillus vandeheii]
MSASETGWIILTCVLGIQLVFAIWNVSCLPKVRSFNASGWKDKDMLVSVLIPARNEKLHIQGCLESVLASDTTGFRMEVLVLDDRSEDETAAIVQGIADRDPRVRLLHGVELPAGWMGKSHACHRLVQEAKGEWFMFVDADVRLEHAAIRQTIAAGCEQGGGLVTGFPYQVTKSWMEKLVVPMMVFTIISHLPIFMIRRSSHPMFVAATGAFLLIHRSSYIASGGHAAIQADLVDDMSLAKAVKRAGHPVMLADVHDVTNTRMYQNGAEVWNGYKKNMYEGMGRKDVLLLGTMLMYTLMYVVPPLGLIIGLLSGNATSVIYGLAGTVLGMAVKRVSDHTGGQPWWLAFLQPISMACVIAIGIASWQAGRSGKGYVWKGRRYN